MHHRLGCYARAAGTLRYRNCCPCCADDEDRVGRRRAVDHGGGIRNAIVRYAMDREPTRRNAYNGRRVSSPTYGKP
jgi:hypothetical protein